MARSHLTLAALATAAVPGLIVTGARPLTAAGEQEYDSAVVTTPEGARLVVRVPADDRTAEAAESEAAALQALSAGVRDQLSFAVPHLRGRILFEGSSATVCDLLVGSHIEAGRVPFGDLVSSIGHAVASIHLLPTSFVHDAGLPARTCEQSRAQTQRIVEEADSTGLVPTGLRDRWRQAVAQDEAWRFLPTVINGTLETRSFLVEGSTVRGILGWSGLQVADPALDLRWVYSLRRDLADSIFAAYRAARPSPPDDHLAVRALLYSELEAARWLVHGRAAHDDAVVGDAVRMMDTLVDRLHRHSAAPLQTDAEPTLTAGDVETMLAESSLGARVGTGRTTGLPPVEDFSADDEDDDDEGDEGVPAEEASGRDGSLQAGD